MVWACLCKASWVGVWPQTIFHGKGLLEEGAQQESHPEQSGEMDNLKHLALHHLFRVINISGHKCQGFESLVGLLYRWSKCLTTAETQEKLKPLQSEIVLKPVALWTLPSGLLFAHRFPLLCYFPSLQLQLLSPWYKLFHVSVSAAGSLSASKKPLL